jgi:hypothetical protein
VSDGRRRRAARIVLASKNRRPDVAGGYANNAMRLDGVASVQTGAGPAQAFDFVLHLQLATLQFRYFQPVARWMRQRFSDFILKRAMSPF